MSQDNTSVCNTIIGNMSNITDNSSYNVLMGYKNIVNGDGNIIIGNENSIEGDNNYIVGSGLTVKGNNQIIIGDEVKTAELMREKNLSKDDVTNYCAATLHETLLELINLQHHNDF